MVELGSEGGGLGDIIEKLMDIAERATLDARAQQLLVLMNTYVALLSVRAQIGDEIGEEDRRVLRTICDWIRKRIEVVMDGGSEEHG